MPKTETFNRITVIKQAIKTFHNKGYNGTSIQDLVTATGLNKSSIYNSFGSKQNLFIECLNAYENINHEKISNALLEASNSIEAIKFIMDIYATDASTNCKGKGCLMANSGAEIGNQYKSINSLLIHARDQSIYLFENLIEKGQKENIINTKRSPNEYAWFLYSSIHGLLMSSTLSPDKKHIQDIVKIIIQTIA